MKCIECFLFNNEFDMLNLKLTELYPYMDLFILVESNKTFTGDSKLLYFEENKHKYQNYLDKIKHYVVDNTADSPENSKIKQRDTIKDILKTLNLNNDDVIFITDVNEIINSFIIDFIKKTQINGIYTLSFDHYFYNYKNKSSKSWYKTKMLNYGTLLDYDSISRIRETNTALITNLSGWRFSYFGDSDFILNKLKCKYKNNNTTREQIIEHINLGKDLLNNDTTIIKVNDDNILPYNFDILLGVNLQDSFTLQMEKTYKTYMTLLNVFKKDLLPEDHRNFLFKLRDLYNFNPNVCYDIGSAVLHWTRHAHKIWPNSKVILFDAFDKAEIFYKNYDYNIGVLSDEDNKEVQFYQNDLLFGGNSYYKESGNIFNNNHIIVRKTRKLDSVVEEKGFPYPDLIKIDVQGAELDILRGAIKVLSKCKYLIVELQDVYYNEGAPLAHVTIQYLREQGWDCIAHKFSDNGPDGDYCFVNTMI